MIAVVLEDGILKLKTDYPQPQPRTGEALLRVRLAGICGTDLALVGGYKGGYRGIPGHEYVADVVSAPGNGDWLGRRVVGEINTSCGDCARCRAGLKTHCRWRRILGIRDWDGAFAQYLVSPLELLHALPPDLADTIAVFTEPLAAAFAVVRDLPPDAGSRVAIYGDGRLGQLIALVMKATGFDVLLVGRHPQKLQIGASMGIPTVQWDGSPMQLPEFDIAVDATGGVKALPSILESLRPRGTLILKSTSSQMARLDLAPLVVKEIRLIGSRCGPFPEAIEALVSGAIDPRPLISAQVPLRDGVHAFSMAREPGMLKVLLVPDLQDEF